MSGALERLVIINDRVSAEGGATSLAIENAVEVARRGIPVTFFGAEGVVCAELLAAGVEVIQIPGEPISAYHRVAGMTSGLYRRETRATLERWIAANDTPGTAYHVHAWVHFMSPSIFVPLGKLGRRLVLTTHDYFLTCPNGAQYSFGEEKACPRVPGSLACITHNCDRRAYADKLWRVGRQAIRQRIYDLARGQATYIAIHENMLPALVRGGMPAAQIKVVLNPVRPFTDTRVEVENNKQVLFIGRLSYEKGPDLAAEAARQAGYPIGFVGEGPMREELARINPEATFYGWRTRDEIGEICATARAVVMPSRLAEPYGLVASEALWSGLPVIASDNANLTATITQAGAGLAFSREAGALAGAIGQICGDDALARQMSLAAFDNTRGIGNRLCDWTEAYLATYAEMLS